jgi:hypothetical protein
MQFLALSASLVIYVRHACFDPQPVLYFDQSFQAEGQEMTVLTEDGGECTLDIDCNDQ